MPNYDYICECGKHQELFRKIEDRNKPIKCECGKSMVRTLGAAPGVIFKGTGFYETDYKKKR